MIAADANLLIYAHQPASSFHRDSRAWLERSLSSPEPFGIPVISVHAFLRFMTNTAIHPKPPSFTQAAEIVDSWLQLPNVRILYPGDRHWSLFSSLAADSRLRGAQLTDAAIAAIAIEYGATVHTNDRDFARFPGLRWHNPLQP